MEPQSDVKMREFFRRFNRFMLLLWRLGLGPWVNFWPDFTGRIAVLVHTGRKSGKRRLTPVNYALVDGEMYCTAGFGSVADWYRNIRANPKVEIWLPQGWWEGQAEEIEVTQDSIYLMRQVLIASGIVAPMFGVRPKEMSDAELAQAIEGYRLIHVRRTAACTGEGGPGDLAWFWPAATFVLAAILWLRRKK